MLSARSSPTFASLLLSRLQTFSFNVSFSFKLSLLIGISVILIFADQRGWSVLQTLRLQVVDYSTPFLTFIRTASVDARQQISSFGELMQAHQENQHLKAQLASLQQWQALAEQLSLENQQLKKILKSPELQKAAVVTARVMTNPLAHSTHNVLINAGSKDGVAKNQPVITRDGIVGRISEVGQHYARVMLITDINSRIPVREVISGQQAIISGQLSGTVKIPHVADETKFKPGQKLFTSGKGGIFPANLPVGVTVQSSNTNSLELLPYVQWNQLDLVQVLPLSPAWQEQQTIAE